MVLGGDFGSMLIRAGDGTFRMRIHITIPILIPIIHLRPWPGRKFMYTVTRSKSNRTTGTIVKIRKATTPTSKAARAVG
jgi:hypothetical protein